MYTVFLMSGNKVDVSDEIAKELLNSRLHEDHGGFVRDVCFFRLDSIEAIKEVIPIVEQPFTYGNDGRAERKEQSKVKPDWTPQPNITK